MKKLHSTIKQLTLLICMLCTTSTFADDSGTCGENLTWTYVEATKTLTISGSGAMIDASASGYPWHNYRESISKVVLENGVTNIGSYAFAGCTSLHSITIPNSVSNVGSNAFQGIIKIIWLTNTPPSGWQEAKGTVNYVSNNQFGTTNDIIIYPFLSSMFEVDGIKYVPVSPSERTCDVIDCVYDESKTEVNINTTVTYQGIDMKVLNVQPYAFYQNPYLQKVNLGISGCLGKYVLYGCKNLQTAVLGQNVTNIEEYAFSGCSKLEGIVIPDAVQAIGQYAFSECYSLASTIIGDGTKTIGQYAFSGCSNMTSAKIGNGTKTISDYAFSGCTSMKSLLLGDSTKYINPYAFQNCSSLCAISISGSVRSVGDNAFSGCKSLNEVVIKERKESGDTTLLDNFRVRENQSGTIVIDVAKGDELSFTLTAKDGSIKINGDMYLQSTYSARSKTYKKLFDKAERITIYYKVDNYYAANISIQDIKLVESKDLLISSTVPVFADCPLDSANIDRNISYISNSPFYNNTSLRSVTITNNVEDICEKEFYGCTNLQSMEIGNGVTSIGDWAFSGCTSLNHFLFGFKVNTIGKEAFSDCTALTEIISRATVPPTCGEQALDDINKWTCKLIVPQGYVPVYQTANQWKDFFFIEEGEAPEIPPTAISLNKTTTKLLVGENETLIAVITPDEATQRELKWKSSDESVAEVDENGVVTAKKAGTATITVQSVHAPMITASCEVTVLSPNIIFADATVKAICVANWDTNGDGELSEAEAAAVSYLGLVFWDSKVIISFDELKYFTGLSSIGYRAFFRCKNLTSVTIPNSVTSIGERAFYDCSGLTSVTIPNSVTTIGYHAFCGCSGLTSIVVESSNSKYDSRGNCNAIIETASNTLISGCNSTIIPNSVTSIESGAFYYCSGLTSVTIPNSVTTIGDYAFCGCSGLTSIVVESSNSKYDSRDNCNAIIETANNTLVLGCKNTIIPNSVMSIGESAFSECSSLTSVTIPNSVTTIGDYAFYGCSGLTSVTSLNPTPPTITSNTFSNYTATLNVPEGSKTAYRNAEYWKKFTNIVEIDPSGIQTITLDKDINSPLYDLNGRKLKEPRKGVNIIGGKKVLLK